jgi:hypothetical protein
MSDEPLHRTHEIVRRHPDAQLGRRTGVDRVSRFCKSFTARSMFARTTFSGSCRTPWPLTFPLSSTRNNLTPVAHTGSGATIRNPRACREQADCRRTATAAGFIPACGEHSQLRAPGIWCPNPGPNQTEFARTAQNVRSWPRRPRRRPRRPRTCSRHRACQGQRRHRLPLIGLHVHRGVIDGALAGRLGVREGRQISERTWLRMSRLAVLIGS